MRIEDAEFLEKQFQPDFTQEDIVGLDNFNAYLSLLVSGKPVKPFNFETYPPAERNFAQVQGIKELSSQKYGRAKEEIDLEIAERFAPKQQPVPDPNSFAAFPQF